MIANQHRDLPDADYRPPRRAATETACIAPRVGSLAMITFLGKSVLLQKSQVGLISIQEDASTDDVQVERLLADT
jgi:hypothetical protein